MGYKRSYEKLVNQRHAVTKRSPFLARLHTQRYVFCLTPKAQKAIQALRPRFPR